MQFYTSNNQEEEIINWTKEHKCSVTYTGATGGGITYSFTPTGIGIITIVTCACGSKIDVTEYDGW